MSISLQIWDFIFEFGAMDSSRLTVALDLTRAQADTALKTMIRRGALTREFIPGIKRTSQSRFKYRAVAGRRPPGAGKWSIAPPEIFMPIEASVKNSYALAPLVRLEARA